jgi:hypothetical protein
MRFKEALWDESDPHYAPCTTWGGNGGRFLYWKAPARYVKAGYQIKSRLLGTGQRGDQVPAEWAMQARDMTREMLRWYDGADAPKTEPGTWHWLIGRYKSDPFSRYHEVQANTRIGYDQQLVLVDEAIGPIKISDTNYEMLMTIKSMKEAKGRSKDHIHRWFSTLSRLATHGVLIDAPGAARVKEIRSNMRIEKPAARTQIATRDQVFAIVAEADKDDMDVFAIGLLIQYWYQLRAIDVRGDYFDGVWERGIEWEHFNEDLSSFTKVISKTRRSLPEPHTFDLTLLPDLRARIIRLFECLPEDQRCGPVTISPRSGVPYTKSGWNQAWRRLRKRAGVDRNVWLMDTRAGALTEASQIEGVTPMQIRNAAQHQNLNTTSRYIRGRSKDLNRVVELRAAHS